MQDLYTTAVQIPPRKEALDPADFAGPTRQHELDHTDHTDHADQGPIFSALKYLDHDL